MGVRLTLAMIVRDAAGQLPACLASVRGLVDEIVIADTGSRDDTVSLAGRLGARVLRIPWEEDFARARNLGLEAVAEGWVLVLDADERLDPGPGGAGAFRAQLTSGPDAFQITIRNYMKDAHGRVWDRPAQPNPSANRRQWPESQDFPVFVEHQNVRLFRRCPELYFVGRLHESVGPRVRAAGLKLGESVGRIHHFGLALAPEAQADKNRRYFELARLKAAEQPGDAQAQFELGVMQFDNFHADAEALRSFERALRLDPDLAVAWFYAGAALLRLGHPADALAFLEQAAARGPRTALLEEMRGDAEYNCGHFAAAGAAYRAAQTLNPEESGLASKLALAELRAGDPTALGRLEDARDARPDLVENHDRLAAACLHLGREEAAEAALENRLHAFPEAAEGYLRLAALQHRQGHAARARATLAAGRDRLPHHPQLDRAWEELLSNGPEPAEAAKAAMASRR